MKKRKLSDSRAFVWCADCSYTLYTFCVMLDGKERKKKKEEKIEIFAFDFLDCEEK